MKVLILDDNQNRHKKFRENWIGHELTHVETVDQCIQQLDNHGPWDFCFLDHDLDGKIYVPSGPGTGFEVANWLEDNPGKMPKNVFVHSFNDFGALKMVKTIPGSIYFPGAWEKNFEFLLNWRNKK